MEPPSSRTASSTLANTLSRAPVLALALFAVNAWICRELFVTPYLVYMDSIEGAYIGLSRWILAHPFDWSWFPLWYDGIPFQNTYPPLLHFLVAGVAGVGGISAALSHHVVSAVMYCLGPVTLFLFLDRVSRRRSLSFLTALVYSLASPSAMMAARIGNDVGSILGPRRLQALIRYGESPHIAAMTLLPLALLALRWALAERRPLPVYAAVLSLVAVVLTNWVGAVALAAAVVAYLLAFVERGWGRVLLWSAALGGLAYAVASPWIPPSTLVAIRYNAQHVVGSYPMGLPQLLGGVLLLAVVAGTWMALRRLRVDPMLQFGAYLFLLLGPMALAWLWFDVYLMPQPDRYHLEMEMAVAILVVFGAARLPRRVRQGALVVLLAFLAVQLHHDRRAAETWIQPRDITDTVEYHSARWLAENLPGARVFATGSTRFWLAAFTDNPQFGGGFDHGNLNRWRPHVDYGIVTGAGGPETALTWLRAYGIDAIIVGGPQTRDAYHDYHAPGSFEGVFPVLWRDGDDVIRQVPRRRRSLAHVIPPEAVVNRQPGGYTDTGPLGAYVAATESPDAPEARLRWRNQHDVVIDTSVPPGQLLSVQIPYHAGWRATVGGSTVPVRADALGQMVIEPACGGPCTVDLKFTGGAEMLVARTACVLALLAPLLLLGTVGVRWRRAGTWMAVVAIVVANLLVAGRYMIAASIGQMGSVEGGHISIAKWTAAHLGDWGWFPLWYGGTPLLNTYQPLEPFLAAATARVLGLTPAHAYHLLAGLLYVLGGVTVLWLARTMSGSRTTGLVAGLGYSLLSPSAWLFPAIAEDMGTILGPRRFQDLAQYGEGPHIVALTLIPVALIALRAALRKTTPARVLLAAIAVAAVPLANWIGAVGCAMAVLALLLTLLGDRPLRTVAVAAGIGVLAYALASPWLPPSNIATISRNSAQLAGEFPMTWVQAVLWAGLLVLTLVAWRVLARLGAGELTMFSALYTVLMAGIVAPQYWFGVYAIAQPHRYHLELELALVLLGASAVPTVVRRLKPGLIRWAAAAVALVVVLFLLNADARRARYWVRPGDVTETVEYQIARQLEATVDDGRIFAVGSTRYWLDVFSNVPQFGGAADQGMVNPFFPILMYGIPYTEGDGERTAMWLRTVGASAVVVTGPEGRDAYKDFRDPDKFDGVLPERWRDGDDVIYEVPQRSTSLARIVPADDIVARPPTAMEDIDPIQRYHAALENPALPVPAFHWITPDRASIEADVAPGQVVSVRISDHPGWRAEVDGREVAIQPDGLGFMIIDPGRPGHCRIDLLWDTGLERDLTSGAAVAVPVLILLWSLERRRRALRRPPPA